MVRRSAPKNEVQDPTLPHKKRARWRVIGAAVLAMAAIVILPLALESEPKRPLEKVEIRIPQRAYLEHGNRTWLDTASRDAPPAEIIAASGESVPPVSPQLIATEDAPPPVQGSVSAPAGETPLPVAAPVVTRVDIDPKAKPAKPAQAATETAKPDKKGAAADKATKAGSKQAAKDAPKPAAKASSGNQEAAAKASKLAKAPPAAPEASPMPKRRTDRSDLQSASPSGYVVQIGAFSSSKGARTQVARARELGFEAYTETLKTKQGDRIRVRVGPYLTREQADVARAKLRNRGVDSVLIAP